MTEERMACPECGSFEIDMVGEESEEMNCAACGYDFQMTDAEWREFPAQTPGGGRVTGPHLTFSPDHPHGPEDPRWIDDDGRCVLCGRDYWEGEAARLLAALDAEREALNQARTALEASTAQGERAIEDMKTLRAALGAAEDTFDGLRAHLIGLLYTVRDAQAGRGHLSIHLPTIEAHALTMLQDLGVNTNDEDELHAALGLAWPVTKDTPEADKPHDGNER